MSDTPTCSQPLSAEFRLKEYGALRKEIELVLKEAHALERYVLIAVGASWVWLVEKHIAWWGFLVPIIFAALGAIRGYGFTKTFDRLHGYLLKVEASFCGRNVSEPQGWEHYLDTGSVQTSAGKPQIASRATGYSKGAVVFWLILICATIAMLLLRWRQVIK